MVLVGKAQERVAGWRGFKDPSSPRHSDAHPHLAWRRQSLFVDHFYFYLWNQQWGPAFVKLCAYAPYPLWVWCNGHQWAKQQLTQAGIGFEALDNGLRACQDPAAAERVCQSQSAGHLRAGLERWLSWLPGALTEQDRRPGLATTSPCVNWRSAIPRYSTGPKAARLGSRRPSASTWTLAGPSRPGLVVDRRIRSSGTRPTPGRFATRVVTRGIDPHLHLRPAPAAPQGLHRAGPGTNTYRVTPYGRQIACLFTKLAARVVVQPET